MTDMNDGLPLPVRRRSRDLARMTLGELMAAGDELRRRSDAVFADMTALEAQLRKHLPHGGRLRPQDLS